MIQIRIFNLSPKNVSIMRHIKIFGITFFANLHQISSFDIETLHFLFRVKFSIIWNLHIQLVNWEWPSEKLLFVYPKKLYFNQTAGMTHFHWFCAYCGRLSSTKISVPQPHLLKIFDHPLIDKTLKRHNILASQHFTHSELLFLTEQSTNFVSMKQYRHTSKTTSPSACFAQFTYSAKFHEKISSEIGTINNDPSIEFQNMFDPIKQEEELIEPRRVILSELSDIDILKEFLQGFHG